MPASICFIGAPPTKYIPPAIVANTKLEPRSGCAITGSNISPEIIAKEKNPCFQSSSPSRFSIRRVIQTARYTTSPNFATSDG